MPIALVTNAASGRNRRDPDLRARLHVVLGSSAIDLAPADAGGWSEVAKALLSEGVDRVAVSGGDGTLHCLLSALAGEASSERWPAVALMRAGTMNTLAANLRVSGRPEVLAATVATAVPVSVPFLRVGSRVGFLFGVGVPVTFLRMYYAGKTGPLGAAWLLARVVAGLPVRSRLTRDLRERTEARVSIDGAPWGSTSWVGVGAGTVPSLGLGFQTCPHTPRAGHLEAYGFGGTPWSVATTLPAMLRGRAISGERVEQSLGRELKIEADGPLPYMIDGDLYPGESTLRVTVGGEVRFLRPAAARALPEPAPLA